MHYPHAKLQSNRMEEGIVLRGKREPFWFTSLGQMVQFDTNFVELCRTILVISCGLEKSHYNSRVSLHEALTKKTPSKIFDMKHCLQVS